MPLLRHASRKPQQQSRLQSNMSQRFTYKTEQTICSLLYNSRFPELIDSAVGALGNFTRIPAFLCKHSQRSPKIRQKLNFVREQLWTFLKLHRFSTEFKKVHSSSAHGVILSMKINFSISASRVCVSALTQIYMELKLSLLESTLVIGLRLLNFSVFSS